MSSAPICPTPPIRRRLVVSGQVQGVGFRPFVFRQAEKFGLTGFTLNSPEGVVIEVQGAPASVEGFLADFEPSLPPLARLTEKRVMDVAPVAGETESETGFVIRLSEGGQGHNVLISPDVATCPDCQRELLDPADPRHLYPFINCVNCGPRYTITRSIPYDRPATSMACFALCEACAREYGDPRDRRFHAQPNACPACGPTVWLTDAAGRELARGADAMKELARRLVQGEVAAVKGLGGFHLCCDATSDAAVAALRRRKNRPGKPLAVMVPDLETLGRVADVSPMDADILTGRERPIVLVRIKKDAPLAAALSPDTDFLGAMLPYAPLQHVLFIRLREAQGNPALLPALVMTSGNFSGEPIALGNREALARLATIADCFLLHDRDILIRVDDSVARVNPELGAPQFLRRARGYTPAPVDLEDDGPCVLGVGPELKTTLCLTKSSQAFVSQHIGDLQNLETLQFYREIRNHLEMILQVRPQAVVRDLHPDYLSTEEAREFATARNIPLFTLQHHFAHAWAIAAETRTTDPLVCLALDGSGWGGDGTVWGGECLFLDPQTAEMRRLGALSPVPMPGGEAAAREPWRMALAYQTVSGLRAACGLGADAPSPWRSDPEFAQAEPVLLQMLERGVNSPLTTSCGRLFDAVAGLTGLCFRHEYEGQAAMLLEKAQDMTATGRYPCPVSDRDGFLRLDSLALFAAAAEDVRRGAAPATVARRFHLGLIDGLAELARAASERSGTRLVGLSGGVFLNLTLATELPRALRERGLTPLSHLQVPPGDGCVSLGQAAFGRRALALKLPPA